jgi:hypothetical protein
MSSEIERSNMRKQELAAKLVRTEERVLGLVERGLTAAGITLSSLADSESPSASTLVQTVASVEKLHKIAKDICGDAMPAVHTQVNVGTINVSSDLVSAVAQAYAEIDKGQLERAASLIDEADQHGDILEGEIVLD